ncbi:hypothetical protein D3C87_1693170 [compost metagenome]
MLGQLVPGFVIDIERQLFTGNRPAGSVVILSYFIQPQLGIVIRACPCDALQALFLESFRQRGLARGLRRHAQARQHIGGKPGDLHLQIFQVGLALDFLGIPAVHLRARVAKREVDDFFRLEELARQAQAVAFAHPGVHLSRAQSKGDGGVKTECRALCVKGA